jgi:glutamate transport system substrate-binding protein
VIGVLSEEPGMSTRKPDGTFTGFDIEIATSVAAHLGVAPRQITWRTLTPEQREPLLESGEVDLVVAGYSITAQRKKPVSFAGPYFVAGQDLLVRNEEKRITGATTLTGRTSARRRAPPRPNAFAAISTRARGSSNVRSSRVV